MQSKNMVQLISGEITASYWFFLVESFYLLSPPQPPTEGVLDYFESYCVSPLRLFVLNGDNLQVGFRI